MANKRKRQRSKAAKLIRYEVASEEEVKKAIEGILERNAELMFALAK